MLCMRPSAAAARARPEVSRAVTFPGKSESRKSQDFESVRCRPADGKWPEMKAWNKPWRLLGLRIRSYAGLVSARAGG